MHVARDFGAPQFRQEERIDWGCCFRSMSDYGFADIEAHITKLGGPRIRSASVKLVTSLNQHSRTAVRCPRHRRLATLLRPLNGRRDRRCFETNFRQQPGRQRAQVFQRFQ